MKIKPILNKLKSTYRIRKEMNVIKNVFFDYICRSRNILEAVDLAHNIFQPLAVKELQDVTTFYAFVPDAFFIFSTTTQNIIKY